MSKTMVVPGTRLASAMHLRREPNPESSVVVTVGQLPKNQSIVLPLFTELVGPIGFCDASDPDASESVTATKEMFFVAPALTVKYHCVPGVSDTRLTNSPEAP